LICEDLTELDTTGVTAVAWGVSHALVPVFSQAIRRYRWEEGSAGQLLQQGGVRTVVCNSQWVGDVEPDSDMVCGDALAIGTERHLADAETPTTAVTFRFTSEGVFLLRDPSLT
jgi:hypothetical protein